MIPDDPNTLTHQYSGTNNSPRDPLLEPVTHDGDNYFIHMFYDLQLITGCNKCEGKSVSNQD